MFQSNINLLDSLSSTWSLLQIRNIVKIPDDQLKILNSIPEWSSNQEDLAHSESLTTLEKSDKNTIEVPITDLKGKTASVSSLKFSKNSETDKENNTLQKEMSKISLFSGSPNKHFENRSHIDEDVSYSRKVLLCTGTERGIVIDKTLDQQNFKSQYTNSAIQCQMSQSSQPNFEETTLNKIILPSIDVSVNNESKKEESKCIELVESQGFLVDSVNKIKDSSDTAHSLTDLERKKECSNNIEVIEKDIEESFVSQPIPCAQPSVSKESCVMQKEMPLSTTSAQSSTIHCDNIPDAESNIELNSSDKRSHQHGGKRKRKTKIEKTKKLRSTYASNNEILYSPDQIRSMIDLIKIFNRL